jgi:hypothetical protein
MDADGVVGGCAEYAGEALRCQGIFSATAARILLCCWVDRRRRFNKATLMPDQRHDFESWKREVDRLLVTNYCIDSSDAGIEADYLERQQSEGWLPAQFVEWFGRKYDLISINDLTFRPVATNP